MFAGWRPNDILESFRGQPPPSRHLSLPVSRTRKTITENIGRAVDPTPTSWVFEEEMACCRRMLDRGPAFRARSFAWSSHVIAAAEGDPPSSEAVISEKLKPAGSLDVRVFRPTGTRFFAERFARFVRGCFGFWFCSWRSTRICVGSVGVGPLRRSPNTFEVSSYIDWARPGHVDRLRHFFVLSTVHLFSVWVLNIYKNGAVFPMG